MKSYLITQLVQKFASASVEAFERAHPHDWLIWEPGNWKPATKQTTFLKLDGSKLSPSPAPSPGVEALALVLALAPGKTTCSLGRGEQCDLVINDGTVSTQHLIWSRSPAGEWSITETGSRNGTFVSGRRLLLHESVVIRPLTSIQVGNVTLTLYPSRRLWERLRTHL